MLFFCWIARRIRPRLWTRGARCTHIVDFQDRKLKTFRGEKGAVLKGWVEKYPEKKGYFELKNDVVPQILLWSISGDLNDERHRKPISFVFYTHFLVWSFRLPNRDAVSVPICVFWFFLFLYRFKSQMSSVPFYCHFRGNSLYIFVFFKIWT